MEAQNSQLKEVSIDPSEPLSQLFTLITSSLSSSQIPFTLLSHKPVTTSQQAAEERGDTLASGAKVSLLKAEFKDQSSQLLMSVISASEEIHWNSFKKIVKTKQVKLANDEDLSQSTFGCKKGAVPPFGSLFGQPVQVYVDQSLIDQGENINFNCGMNTKSVNMKLKDYLEYEKPLVCKFTKKYI